MTKTALFLIGVMSAGAAIAQGPPTTDEAAIVYDQCLSRAAVRVSRTSVPDDRVYDQAKRDCAETRALVLSGYERDAARVAALDAIDRDKAASMPALTKQVRERRRQREAQFPGQ